MSTVKVATTAINIEFDKKKNLEKMIGMVHEAANEGAKLVMFAEQALQGYLDSLIGPLTTKEIRYQQENAEIIPEGESTQAMIRAAKEHDIYIIYGMTERDKKFYDVLYNTAVLVGPEGFIGTYRKVHQPIDEKHVYTPGYAYPVYDTKIGRIGMQICFDKEFPEVSRELVLQGAEILCILTAWEEFIGDIPENVASRMGAPYDMFDSVRAMENQVWVMSANMVGKIGGGNYCGKSNIVDPNGYILATCGDKEGIVYSDIDVKDGILRTRADFLLTCVRDRKPETYRLLSSGQGLQGWTPLQNAENTSKEAACQNG